MDEARRLPGRIATSLMILITTFWAYWGTAEMYHEGWWGAWYNRLPYLIPMTVCLLATLLAFAFPILAGGLIVVLGISFAIFFGDNSAMAIIGVLAASVGGLFLADGFIRRKTAQKPNMEAPWWRRNLHYLLAVGIPLLFFLSISFYMLPIVLTRQDDGIRSARLIEGNLVQLVWAPQGPGWNWKQPWGGYPSWQSIALYGMPPIGMGEKPGYEKTEEHRVYASQEDMAQWNLCRFLNEDGKQLLDTPQDIWRMPTTDEIVRSLVRHGENAGCQWDGEFRSQVNCERQPDKESPLWAADLSPIYYWTADSYSERSGYFVSYNGYVNATHKTGGNPRHSYRCVRTP